LYGQLSAVLLRFSTAAALAYAAYAMCRAPVLPLYARDLGAGPEFIGLVAGASTLTGVLLKLPAGAISDAIGRRAVLLTAAAVFAFTPFAYPLVPSLGALLLLRFVHGSATALFGPTAAASLSDLAPADQRGRWLGTYSAIQGGGQAAGPVIAGLVLASSGYATTFFAAGAIGILAWLLIWAGVPRAPAPTAGSRAAVVAAVRHVLADRRILLTSLAQAGQFVLHGLTSAFLPIYAVERIGLGASEVGLLFGAQMLTTIASRPVFGRLSDRVGRRPMIVIGLATSAIAVWLLPLAATFAALLMFAAIYGGGLAVTTSSTAALITDLTDRSRYGAAHGLFGTIFDVGDALGPIAGGVVAARLGYPATFQIAGAAVVMLAIVFAVMSSGWKRANSPIA
jgi:MFS transporter, DHA1 family, multidrug resistance protein